LLWRDFAEARLPDSPYDDERHRTTASEVETLHEIELKLVPQEPAGAIWSRVARAGLADSKRGTRTLRGVYYDTSDLRLKKAGIALRIRRVGRKWVQTVKIGRKIEGGLSQALELEAPVRDDRIDFDAISDVGVRRTIFEVTAGESLVAVCETTMRRTTQHLKLGAARIELAFDVGTITGGDSTAPWSEIELELIEGPASALFDVAKMIFPKGGLRFSRMSKSARGYLLRDIGVVDEPLEPHKAGEATAHSDDTTELAARRALGDCLEQISANAEVVPVLDSEEGPHQLRVGLRRLRSAFAIYQPAIGCDEMERLSEEAKWLASEVGRLRDVEACSADVAGPEMAAHPGETGLAALLARLSDRAAAIRAEVRDILVSVRVQSFIFDLAKFVLARGWQSHDDARTALLAAPVTGFAQEALDITWKKVSKRARRMDQLEAEQRHDLRKALKKLRYSTEFLSGCFPAKRVKPFLKRLRELQGVFGELNDAAMTRTLLADPTLVDTQSVLEQRAVGWIVGASQARSAYAWEQAKERWHDLRDADRFWR
jgi:triphosphatase